MIAFLSLLSPRTWFTIGAGIAVALAIGVFWAWIASKDHAIHEARDQRDTAIHTLVLSEVDLITARVNEAVLSDAIGRQNAAVQSLSAESARRLQEAAVGLARAERLHATDAARLAVLGRPLVAATACERADEAAARARAALQ